MAVAKKTLAEQRRTYAHASDNDIVGLKERVDGFMTLFGAGSPMVVLVHGMGGIGKTTFARQVFRQSRSQVVFEKFAWAYVSQQFQLETLYRDILNQLISGKDEKERNTINGISNSELPGKLFEVLETQACLLVLDDVWTDTDWKRLQSAFPIRDSSSKSKILITTRNPQILAQLGHNSFEVGTLDEDSSWKLLQNKGGFQNIALDEHQVELATKMLAHCKGHPLAIAALGGVLATKTLQEWEAVLDDLQSHLQEHDSYSSVYEVLAMGYYDLSYNLKPCFLHLGSFPEDSRINVERLYHLWIAEDIVSTSKHGLQVARKISLDDVADDYLNQLVQKSMVQVTGRDFDKRIETCMIHDLMRDKCLDIAKEENFLDILDHRQQGDSDDGHQADERIRRLSVFLDLNETDYVVESLSKETSSLRSLFFFSGQGDFTERSCGWIETICQRFQLLRILDFEDIGLTGTLPRKIGSLIFLRHLSLRGTHITQLPSSIRYLKSLIILDLRVKDVFIIVPNLLGEMSSLRYLYFPQKSLSEEEEYPKQGYTIVREEPFKGLDNLIHLEKVEEIDLDRVDEKGLVKLRGMKKLSANCASSKERLLPFVKSTTIKHLTLYINSRILDEDSTLLSTCSSLRTLHIDAASYVGIILSIKLEMFPNNLVSLGFWYCTIPEDPMPILGKLPNLRTLELRLCYQGTKFHCSAIAFPELTSLTFDGLGELTNWTVDRGGIPKLQRFEIYNSPISDIPYALPSDISIHCSPEFYKTTVRKFRVQAGASGSNVF